MAAELITPVDQATGVPYVIMPRADLPPVPRRQDRNLARTADLHHPFHDKNALLAQATMAAAATRNCRVQWTDYDDHHHKYHRDNFIGPPLPQTETEHFRTVLFAAAAFVPARAIAFDDHGKPYYPWLDMQSREWLWNSGQLRIGSMAPVRDFLLEYPLRHDFAGINESTIDEFLHTGDLARKRELGNNLLAVAAYDAACPIRDLYREARVAGLIPAEKARTAGRFILGTMTMHRGKRALGALTARLAA